jgi:hypothetical protein
VRNIFGVSGSQKEYNRPYIIQQSSFKEKNQRVKIKKFTKVHGGPPLNMVQLRHLMLKTNGEDSKR